MMQLLSCKAIHGLLALLCVVFWLYFVHGWSKTTEKNNICFTNVPRGNDRSVNADLLLGSHRVLLCKGNRRAVSPVSLEGPVEQSLPYQKHRWLRIGKNLRKHRTASLRELFRGRDMSRFTQTNETMYRLQLFDNVKSSSVFTHFGNWKVKLYLCSLPNMSSVAGEPATDPL